MACTEAGLLHVLRDVFVNFVKTTPVVRLVLSELPLADEANLAQLEVSECVRARALAFCLHECFRRRRRLGIREPPCSCPITPECFVCRVVPTLTRELAAVCDVQEAVMGKPMAEKKQRALLRQFVNANAPHDPSGMLPDGRPSRFLAS